MVNYRPHIAFSWIMGTYFLIRYLRDAFPELPDFVRFQLTDFLFIPAMCLFALMVIRTVKRDRTLTIPWYYVLLQTLLVAVYFEVYLPEMYPHRYVGDILDAGMYGLASLLFISLQHRL